MDIYDYFCGGWNRKIIKIQNVGTGMFLWQAQIPKHLNFCTGTAHWKIEMKTNPQKLAFGSQTKFPFGTNQVSFLSNKSLQQWKQFEFF